MNILCIFNHAVLVCCFLSIGCGLKIIYYYYYNVGVFVMNVTPLVLHLRLAKYVKARLNDNRVPYLIVIAFMPPK